MINKLSVKDQQFADFYFGGPDDVMGNATACYRYLHPRARDNTCQFEESNTLLKPMVAKYLQSRREELTEATGINAEYVLRQSVRLLDRAMGNEAVEKQCRSKLIRSPAKSASQSPSSVTTIPVYRTRHCG